MLYSISGLLVSAFFLQTQSARVASMPYWAGRRWLYGEFMTSFLLFVLLEGLWATSIQTPATNQTARVKRRITVQPDTIIQPKNTQSSNPAYYEEWVTAGDRPVGDQSGKRLGLILLFMLGVTLSAFAAGRACNLACAGNGTLAYIVGLLGVGIFASSFFLLSRASIK